MTVLRDGRLAVTWSCDSNAGNIDIIRARLVNADGSGRADFKVNAEAPVTANFDNHCQLRGNQIANQIIGSTRNDTLTAGSGFDRMTDGADADTFVLVRVWWQGRRRAPSLRPT